MPKVLKGSSFDPYFIQYIIDNFRCIFNKTLDKEDIKSIDKLIELLENIKNLNIEDIIEELKNSPKNRLIHNKLNLSLENKKDYIESINKIIKEKPYLSGYVNLIYEIGHRFILEYPENDPCRMIEEQPYFLINHLKKIYKTGGKFTVIKPIEHDKIQKIYFNSPDKLYKDAINKLKQIKTGDTFKLMPLNFSLDKIEPKKILNSRKERNADLRKFINFLDLYLKETLEDDKQYVEYYIFIICMVSPFADYVANSMKYSKECLELSIKKAAISDSGKLILANFNVNYDGIEYNDDNIGSKPSKEFYAFFKSYLKNSKELKREYEGFKKEFCEDEKHYMMEIEKFNYKQKENSYESKLPFTNGIQGITREFPAEEANNISDFLTEQIQSLYPNDKENKKGFLIKDDFSAIPVSVPKIQEKLKPFKYIPASEVNEFPLTFNFEENNKLIIYLHIIEYFLPPNRYVKIFKLKRKPQS
jgi:hypothetical protein